MSNRFALFSSQALEDLLTQVVTEIKTRKERETGCSSFLPIVDGNIQKRVTALEVEISRLRLCTEKHTLIINESRLRLEKLEEKELKNVPNNNKRLPTRAGKHR